MKWSQIGPGAAVFVTALYLAWTMTPRADTPGDFNFEKFGRIPVVDRGRVKPIDTLARTNLMLVSGRQEYKEFVGGAWKADAEAKRKPAVKWLLDTMAYNEILTEILNLRKREKPREAPVSFEHTVVRIENEDVLGLIGLEARPGWLRYSVREIQPRMDKFYEAANAAREIDPKNRSLVESKIVELAQHLEVYASLLKAESPFVVPPRTAKDQWMTLGEGLQAVLAGNPEVFQDPNQFRRQFPGQYYWLNMLIAYRNGDIDGFNRTVNEYFAVVQDLLPGDVRRAGWEVFLNNFAPYYHCAVLYAILFLLGCLSWLVFPRGLNRTTLWVMVLVAFVHTVALGLRMYIQGRPPVTNLYSSAIYIGWTAVITCLIVECFYRNSIALVAGSVIGFLSLIVAHYLGTSGDTMEMMQAVLDTNFWLATHVTTVTYGYTATFLAGFLGICFILLGLFTPMLAKGAANDLSKAVYGVICFALFLSFVGTVLGGIWADQSWGRFWGWDPKENGALLIVIWNAIILHARWGGMVKQRGVAVLAVGGNIITAWSWFGTNLLGVGLHSYGFMAGAMYWLAAFAGTQLLIMGLGLLPLTWWRSFRPPVASSRNQIGEKMLASV